MSWSWLLRFLVASNFCCRVVQSVRATDELDSGFVVTEETHDGHHDYELTTATTTMDPNLKSVYLYLGCYEYWSGNGEYFDPKKFDSSLHKNISVVACILECETKYKPVEYQVAMIRGNDCICTRWEYFSRARIQEGYCNFSCPSDRYLQCGGNLAISVYCNLSKDPKCDMNQDIGGVIPDYNASGLVELKANIESSALGCGKCIENDSVGSAICFKANAITPAQDHFPLNSPAACVLNCRRRFISLQLNSIPLVSAVGWWYNGHDRSPICVCHDNMILQEGGPYVPVEPETCDTPCPGDPGVTCGNLTQIIFNFYCTYGLVDGNCTLMNELPGEPEPDPGDESTDPGGDSTDPVTVATATTSTTTIEPASTVVSSTVTTTDATTTEDITTIATITYPPETTKASTVTSTVGPVETSTMEVVTTTTERQQETTASTIGTTTTSTTGTTTTSTTMPGPCGTCQSVDHYGQNWTACTETVASQACHSGYGMARWKCLGNGTFATETPDYSNCTSPWFDGVYNDLKNLTKNGTLPMPVEKSKELLERVENFLKPSKGGVPYYGHEIANISQFMWFVVGNTSRNSSQGHTEVIRSAMKIPGLLLTNQEAWKEIHDAIERGRVGYDLLVNIERTIFTLTDVFKTKKRIQNFDVLPESEFLASFGTGSVDSSEQEELIFPNPPPHMDSFIKFRAGTEGKRKYPAFVGLSIHPDRIERIMSPALNLFTKWKRSTRADRIINGKLISLTLNSDDNQTDYANASELLAEVTFHHEVEAYGAEALDVHRKLHPGESPRAVRGSAACVFWSPTQSSWAQDGCGLDKTKSDAHQTVCQCDHLTSFALIMDVHNYVGKEFALEVLTLLLCPLSAVSLILCIVIFSSMTAMHSQRTTITKHLCACLLIGIIMILFVADRNYLNLSEGFCTAVGIGTHYIYMAAFVWMGIEGLHLYKMVVCVFDSGRSPTTFYRVTAYGVPVIIVGTTCVVGYLHEDKPYGGDLYCWLNGSYHWSFIGPAAVIMMANMVVLCLALKTAHQMNPTSAHVISRKRSYKTWIRGSFSLTVLLGITWLPGFFVLTGSTVIARVSAYIFVILNASQGVFLFVYHCLLNEKVRAFAGRRVSLPSWFSTTPSSPSGSSKERSQSQNESQLQRKWTMFAVRFGQEGVRRSENFQSVFNNNSNDISVVGKRDWKQEEGSWSFFRAGEHQSCRKARQGVHFGIQDGRHLNGTEKGKRAGLGQTFSSKSCSSASSSKCLVGGSRR